MENFSSNVMPSRFGAGAEILYDWRCACGNINRKFYKNCIMCGIDKKLAKLALSRVNEESEIK